MQNLRKLNSSLFSLSRTSGLMMRQQMGMSTSSLDKDLEDEHFFDHMNDHQIHIFTKTDDPYSQAAKHIFDDLHVQFMEH